MRKRFIQVIVALATTVSVGLVSVPAQAQVRAASTDCPASFTCTWNGSGFSGTPAFSHTMPSTFGACVNISALNGANNNADSVYNKNAFQVSFYDNANGSGYLFSLPANTLITNLSASVENRASSICHE